MKKLLFFVIFILFASVIVAESGKRITVISRESGSGTRGAFSELIDVMEKGKNFRKDHTYIEALITNRTDVMMATVSGDVSAIGYISLGSLNSTVKAIYVNGVPPTSDNIKNGSYRLARPFNIMTKRGVTNTAAEDFIQFILSNEGQFVVSHSYIPIEATSKPFISSKPHGTLVVAGSSSVTPLMELLKEAYHKVNPTLKIEVQMSDSSTGMQATANGTCDIGMASRNATVKENDILEVQQIAIDGIVVIVNPKNSLNDLDIEQIKSIFTGKTTMW